MENKPTNPNANPAVENMDHQTALNILVQGVQFAQSKGVYSLKDASLIHKAVEVFTPEQPAKPPVLESTEEPSNTNEDTTPETETPADEIKARVAEVEE